MGSTTAGSTSKIGSDDIQAKRTKHRMIIDREKITVKRGAQTHRFQNMNQKACTEDNAMESHRSLQTIQEQFEVLNREEEDCFKFLFDY